MEQEALKLVETLNNDTWLEYENNTQWWQPYEFGADGMCCWIKFMGEIVWDSDNDIEYDYDNDCPKYTLKEHVIIESRKILSLLNERMNEIKLEN